MTRDARDIRRDGRDLSVAELAREGGHRSASRPHDPGDGRGVWSQLIEVGAGRARSLKRVTATAASTCEYGGPGGLTAAGRLTAGRRLAARLRLTTHR